MNFGHGELGFTFCPMAKSEPEPEYSTVFSDPIALVALSMTAFASCAKATDDNIVTMANAARHFLNMFTSQHREAVHYGNENTTTESVAIAATYCFPFLP